jgi:hypothetical protein
MSSFDPASLLGGYTQEELEAAFALVAPAGNWKLPIKAELPSITPIAKRKMIAYAVTFFTGGAATFSKTPGGKLLVTAPGYYASVGA